MSPSDPDDLEFFQDIIFESPWGRVHIEFYQHMFKKYYKTHPDWFVLVFSKYLEFLNKASVLFTIDAFSFIFRQEDIKLVEKLLNTLSFEMKMTLIRSSEKYPKIIQLVPKLKLYNLFS